MPTISMTGGRSLQLHLLLMWVLCMLAMINFSKGSGNVTIGCLESERRALLSFKKGLRDQDNLLSSWKSSGEEDCCRWSGVRCDKHTGHVVMLELQPMMLRDDLSSVVGLSGEISSSLLELPYLNHLDLSYNGFQKIPDFIGSLSNLTYLDLSGNSANGTFPYQLGNLSKLQYLYFSSADEMRADSIEWLDRLSSLRVLDLSYVTFGKAVDWLKSIKMHPFLSTLQLSNCQFPEINLSSLSHVDPSKSIASLSLYHDSFNSSINSWLFNVSTALVDLYISDQQLKGPIPDSFGDMISLVNLDLSFNQFEGGIPSSFANLCQLKELYLSDNNLSGSLSGILENLSCAKNSLEILMLNENQLGGSIPDITEFQALKELNLYQNNLDGSFPESFKQSSKLQLLSLARNQFVGSLPDLSKFSFLTELYLANNELNGSLTESIGKLSDLQILDVSSNNLSGVLSEAHLSNLSKLQQLDLSDNSLALNFSSDWTPTFHLDTIKLSSCKLGPQFPSWLQSQKSCSFLDISNSEISDAIPNWFWNFPSRLEYLNLSFNHIYGKVPDISSKCYTFPAVDLSNNLFYGLIPQFLFNTTVINLSKNKFTGSLSFLCTIMHSALNFINLSDNLLSGGLPDCWAQLKLLVTLNLENNNLSGIIPRSIGSLSFIQTLRFRNNSFTGEFPSSLKNCSSLELLDVGGNKLTGKLPEWVGDSLTSLIVLRLRSNEFYGEIPSTLCHLTSIQIIDFSFNNLSGAIPSCLNNLTAMTQNRSLQETKSHWIYYSYGDWNGTNWGSANLADYVDYAWVMWKGIEQEYGKTLLLLKVIDLSNNNLTGGIPEQVTSLLGMISLNLSRNCLTGSIPEEIGQLKALEVLDLSHNQLSGKIPESIADISFLGVLDLSNNQLTGRIPTGTQLQGFSASAYSNNSGLCGAPLPKCPGEGTFQDPSSTGATGNNTEAGGEWFERSLLYAGGWAGFFVGFWGLYGSLMMSNSWRLTYFQFLNKVVEWLYFC